MTLLPDYYAILSLDVKATAQEIRTSYKKKALENHPDKVLFTVSLKFEILLESE